MWINPAYFKLNVLIWIKTFFDLCSFLALLWFMTSQFSWIGGAIVLLVYVCMFTLIQIMQEALGNFTYDSFEDGEDDV